MRRVGLFVAVLVSWGLAYVAKTYFGFEQGYFYSLLVMIAMGFLWK